MIYWTGKGDHTMAYKIKTIKDVLYREGGKPSGRNGSKGPGASQDSDSAGMETSEGTDAADTKTSTD